MSRTMPQGGEAHTSRTPSQRGRPLLTPKRAFTATMGVIALLRGLAYIWPDGTPAGLHTLSKVPGGLVTWGWIWAAVGAFAIVWAVTRRSSTLPLTPFATVNFLWAGSYLIEWLATAIRDGPESRDWITSLSYIALGVASLTVIRLVDPVEVRERGGRHG